MEKGVIARVLVGFLSGDFFGDFGTIFARVWVALQSSVDTIRYVDQS